MKCRQQLTVIVSVSHPSVISVWNDTSIQVVLNEVQSKEALATTEHNFSVPYNANTFSHH